MNKTFSRRNRLIPVCIILILIATLTPSSGLDSPIPYLDKLVHFLLFMGLSVNICFKYFENKKLLQMLIWAVVLGVLTELLQKLIPGRDLDFYDGIADMLGIVGGYYFYKQMQNWLDKLILKLGA